jgi:hypothetical protein
MQIFVKPANYVQTVRLWSDGPSGQFKNQYMFTFLRFLLERYSLACVQWNFFATSHGKGAVDRIGGSAKKNSVAKSKI